jgi:hypothetical protein
MADDKLSTVKVGGDSPLARRLDPTVISKADPPADWLMQARADLNREAGLQAIVTQGKRDQIPNDDLADYLGSKLNEGWGGSCAQEAYDAALYLLDEYDQLGEGVHLVSTDTGRVVITLTDEDVWDPGMVPREGGGMAQALKRIRPDIEASLTTWTFNQSHEQRVIETLAAKGHQTALLREEGDPRLLVATRKGRTQIVQGLIDHTPIDLLKMCGGTSGMFLQHFEIRTDDYEKTYEAAALEGTLVSSSAMKVSDQTTVNLHHNRAGVLRGVLAQGWVRELARRLSGIMHERSKDLLKPQDLGSIDPESTRCWRARFWVAPPEAVAPLGRLRPDWTVMPVDQAYVIGLNKPKVGVLIVPETFGAETNEMFEKWTTSAHLEFKLYVDWDALVYMAVTGLEYQGQVVK